MAIYHLHIKVLSRSDGKNIVRSAAYRHAQKLFDNKLQKFHDYTKKRDVDHVEFLIPENSPDWLKAYAEHFELNPSGASEAYWNMIEAIEKRKEDAQLARECEFSLPIELTLEQQKELAREFIKHEFVSQGMVADFAIHNDAGNPHVHLLLSTRKIEAEGFGNKERAWNDKRVLIHARASWSEYANRALALHGHDVRIDHRSYQEQGIDLSPSIHVGRPAMDLQKRGQEADRAALNEEIRRDNLQRIVDNPDIIYQKLSAERVSFGAHEVIKEVGRFVESQIVDHDEISRAPILSEAKIKRILSRIEMHEDTFADWQIAKALADEHVASKESEQFTHILAALKGSKELIYMGPGDDGRDRYTTRKMFEVGNKIQNITDNMRTARGRGVKATTVERALAAYERRIGKELNDEQRRAVHHLLDSKKIACVVGRAGTGKSFTLGAARTVWEQSGFTVHGIALSGVAADGLIEDAGMDARTIDSFKLALDHGRIKLDRRSIVVMDEAGMTDGLSMLKVMEAAQQAGAKLVLVGDHAQLQPVGPGAYFRAILERIGFVELQVVMRQNPKYPWMGQATTDFSQGNIHAGFDAYSQRGFVQLHDTREQALDRLVTDWQAKRAAEKLSLSQYIVLAHRNEDVDLLNQKLRDKRLENGEIKTGFRCKLHDGQTIALSEQDRILFTQTKFLLGVRNGRFATVVALQHDAQGNVVSFKAQLDGKANKVVEIDVGRFNHFSLGYAATVHKAQGISREHSFVYAGGSGWVRNLFYVAMSRHKESCTLYADKETHADLEALKQNVSRLSIKDSVLDFPYHLGLRHGVDEQHLERRLKVHLTQKMQAMKAAIADKYEEVMHPTRYWERKQQEADYQAQRTEQSNKLLQQRENAKVVAAYAETNREVGMAWEALKAKTGMDKLVLTDETAPLIKTTPEYLRFESALIHRDSLAKDIMAAPRRYENALGYYPSITQDKLDKQAKAHDMRLTIKQYLAAEKDTLEHEKLAFTIQQSIKAHYPHLKQYAVNLETQKTAAQRYERRTLFNGLGLDERLRLLEVERYLELVKECGALYGEVANAKSWGLIPGHDMQLQDVSVALEAKSLERNELAGKIFQNAIDYSAGLDFYEVGLARVKPGFDKPSDKSVEWATKRWDKLQQHALQQQIQEEVRRYNALSKEPVASDGRLQLAHQINSAIKEHYRAIILESSVPKVFWQTLRQDAAIYANQQFYATLTHEADKALFKEVEQFIALRLESRRAWAELFEKNEAVNFTDFTDFAQSKVGKLSEQKAQSARALLVKYQDHAVYQHFELDYDALKKESGFKKLDNEALKLVTDYAQGPAGYEDKARLARRIVENKDTLKHAVSALKIDWPTLYKDARNGQRLYLSQELLDGFKDDLRALWRYEKANQEAGRAWAKIRKAKEAGQSIPSSAQDRVSRLFAKRDALAAALIEAQNPLLSTAQKDKAQEQAARHEDKMQLIADYAQKRTAFLHDLNVSAQRHGPTPDLLLHYDELIGQIDSLGKRAAGYSAALKAVGLPADQLTQDQTLVKTVLAYNNKIMAEATQDKQDFNLSAEEQQRVRIAQRIIQESVPIEGTLGERYLKEIRGIQSTLPASCRFHPALKFGNKQLPAVIFMGESVNQELGRTVVQAIYLDPQTAKKANLDYTHPKTGEWVEMPSKLSYGRFLPGAAILINQGKDNSRIAIAEGPETALSISAADPSLTVYAVLGTGNLQKVPLTDSVKELILCADYDGEGAESQRRVKAAAEFYAKEKGLDVYQIIPDGKNGKQDFNDVLLEEGIDKVRAYLAAPQRLAEGVTLARLKATVNAQLEPSVAQKAKKAPQDENKKHIEPEKTERPKVDFKDIWRETSKLQDSAAENYLAEIGIKEGLGRTTFRYIEGEAGKGILAVYAVDQNRVFNAVQLFQFDPEAKEATRQAVAGDADSIGLVQLGEQNGRVYVAGSVEDAAVFASLDQRATILIADKASSTLEQAIKDLSPKEAVLTFELDRKLNLEIPQIEVRPQVGQTWAEELKADLPHLREKMGIPQNTFKTNFDKVLSEGEPMALTPQQLAHLQERGSLKAYEEVTAYREQMKIVAKALKDLQSAPEAEKLALNKQADKLLADFNKRSYQMATNTKYYEAINLQGIDKDFIKKSAMQYVEKLEQEQQRKQSQAKFQKQGKGRAMIFKL